MFLNFIGANFRKLSNVFKKRMEKNNLPFDEDLFSDTILKCNEKLKDKNLSDDEIMGYFWMAFKTNTIREFKYLRNNTINKIPDVSDDDNEDDYVTEKFNRVTKLIIDKFGEELYRLFMLHVNGLSYDKLMRETKIHNLKYQFRKIREYVRNNY